VIDSCSELVVCRKGCRICIERDPGKIHNGADFDFDPPVVSHWSQWLGHKRPKVLIVGQDFGDIGYFRRYLGSDDPKNPTNQNLRELLNYAGIAAGDPPAADELTPVFLTNSILCLKEGTMATPIKPRWVKACAGSHLLPLAQFLRAPIVVSMGATAWRAVRLVFGLSGVPVKITLAAGSSWSAQDGTRLFPVCHCSGLGIRNRSWPNQISDWQQIGEAVHSLEP